MVQSMPSDRDSIPGRMRRGRDAWKAAEERKGADDDGEHRMGRVPRMRRPGDRGGR